MIKEKISINKHNLTIYSFSINLIITFISYCMLLQRHFSVDSYAIIYDNSGQQYLMQGRIISYLVNKILNYLKINPTLDQSIFTLILIISIAICSSILVKIVYNFVEENIYNFILINIIIAISFSNVFLLEWFLYPEITLFISIGLVSVIFAIWSFFRNDKLINAIMAFVFLNISMGIYQSNLGIFVIYSLVICYIKYKGELKVRSVTDSVKILAIGGISSILNILTLKVLVYLKLAVRSDREPRLSMEVIEKNIRGILNVQRQIWNNAYGMLPKYILILFVTFVLFGIIYIAIKDKISIQKRVYLFLIILINYLIIFVPHIFTSSLWIAQRTIVPFFTFISALCIIFMVFIEKNKDVKKILLVVSLTFLLVNMTYIQFVASNHVASNKIDQQFSIVINNEIKKYENENKVIIHNISVESDTNPTYSYNNIRYCIYDTNVRAFITPWANVNMINYYSNSNYNKVEMDSEIYDKYFKNKNWDNFIPEEQMVFKGDTLYLIIY